MAPLGKPVNTAAMTIASFGSGGFQMNCKTRSLSALAIVLSGLCGLILASDRALASPERVDQLIQTALQLDPRPDHGAALYRKNCSTCHGTAGYGDAARVIPALAGQRQAYLIKQFADFTELERDATQMHNVAARLELSEPQAWVDLAAYINKMPGTSAPQSGHGEFVSLGEASFRQWCASCHEADGRGDDDGFVPSLRNQHYSYLVHEIRSLAGGHRFNVDPELVLFLDNLETDEVTGLADYISRMKGPVRDRARMRADGQVGN